MSLEKLENNRTIQTVRENNNEPHQLVSTFSIPIKIIPKGGTTKLDLDDRYLSSITELSMYSWPI